MSVLEEAKRYLWLHGTITDTTIDPVDLIRDLTNEVERMSKKIDKLESDDDDDHDEDQRTAIVQIRQATL